MTTEAQEAYSIELVAERTTLSVADVKRLIRSGELPAKRRGRRVLILPEDLRSWLDGLEDY